MIWAPARPQSTCPPPPRWRLNAWGVDAGHQTPHIHRDAWLSGCCDVRVPASIRRDDAAHAGWIAFGEPDPYPRRKTTSPTRALWPEAGLAVLFPATFYHRTAPHAGAERRISLAFDVLAEG